MHTYYLAQADFASLAAVKLLVGELTLLRADSKHALEQAAKIDAVAAGMPLHTHTRARAHTHTHTHATVQIH